MVSVVVLSDSSAMSKRGRPSKSQPTQTEGENAVPFDETAAVLCVSLMHCVTYFGALLF